MIWWMYPVELESAWSIRSVFRCTQDHARYLIRLGLVLEHGGVYSEKVLALQRQIAFAHLVDLFSLQSSLPMERLKWSPFEEL